MPLHVRIPKNNLEIHPENLNIDSVNLINRLLSYCYIIIICRRNLQFLELHMLSFE